MKAKFLKYGVLWAVALGLIVMGIGQMISVAKPGGWTNIHACVNKHTRTVRIPSPGFGCAKGERPVSWSVRGPKGAHGSRGLNGNAGPPGPSGPMGPTGGFTTSGYTDTQFCMNKDGKLEGLDKKSGDCKGDKTLVSIPIKG